MTSFEDHSIWLLLTIIQICSSQTTTTSTTTTTSEDDSFFAASSLEIVVLVAVIVGCPICIALFCWYQKNKTKQFAKKRAERTARIVNQAHDANQRRLIQQQQRQQQAIQMQQIQHGTMQETFKQNSAAPINASNASNPSNNEAIPNIKREPSNTPPPKPPSDPALDMLTGKTKTTTTTITTTKPPPPAHNPPPAWTSPTKKKKEPNFKKLASVSGGAGDIAKMPQESALILPDVEDEVNQPPPEVVPRTKTFDAQTGAPQTLEIDDNALNNDGLDWANPENYGKNNEIEVSITIDDIEEKEDDDDIDDNDKKEDIDKNMSDSSSGEPLNDGVIKEDKNLLKIAQEQMSGKPPPSLQTIFGRKITAKSGIASEEDSSSEDSLLKRQQQYDADPDVDHPEVGSKRPESTFVLNV